MLDTDGLHRGVALADVEQPLSITKKDWSPQNVSDSDLKISTEKNSEESTAGCS